MSDTRKDEWKTAPLKRGFGVRAPWGNDVACILICEDDELYREIAAAAFIETAHKVLFAVNGEEALETFKANPVDLVVTDLVMPNKDGLELIRDIRGLAADMPVLAMTAGVASLKDPLLTAASALGADDVIDKPFRPQMLRQKVDALLARARKGKGQSVA